MYTNLRTSYSTLFLARERGLNYKKYLKKS